MRQDVAHSEPELTISPRPVLVLLLFLGPVLYVLATVLSYPWSAVESVLSFALILTILSLAGWFIAAWNMQFARWFTILYLISAVYLTDALFGTPEFLPLLAIPTLLSTPMIGFRGITVVAALETLSLLALTRFLGLAANSSILVSTGVAIWLSLAVVFAIYLPINAVISWWQAYYRRAQDQLEEARNRQVELKQTLDDLANANLQLSRLNALAQGLRREAEEARRAKEQFVASVSHELRTPLNMIIGFSEMMLQSPDTYGDHIPASLLADLAVVHRNAEHLKGLIDDVLDLSQIEADQMALTKEHVRFSEIVEEATVAVRPLFSLKGLYLTAEVSDDLPLVYCDPTRMREVLMNLLGNAGRHTEQGGVHVRAWREENDLLVSVQDTGSGIAAEDLGKLFQPFQQLDSSIRRRYGGTGLGLSITKRFIELHGGKIWVESQLGSGTTFSYRVPLDMAPASSDGFARWLTPDWEFTQQTRPSKTPRAEVRPRLVVCEQHPSLQQLLERYWDAAEIVPVRDLDEAQRAIATTPSQALLINDASITGALQRVGSMTLPYGTPVLMCSVPAPSDPAATLGVSDYLVKPVSPDALLAALDRLALPGKTVLVVDDEPDALQLFRRVLSSARQGYRILQARDGREALGVVHEHRPDAILLDLVMPNLDGFQVIAMRERDEVLRAIPIIVVSAQDPAGEPVVSDALAVTHRGGLSARQLLVSIRAISQALSVTGQVGDPARLAELPG